jgi:ABC-2 type transport system ATP-binding protein
MASAIVCEGLTRRFGAHTAVDALQLEVAEGEVFGFLGPNGAGKTTTVRLLNGVLAPSAGRAWVMGLDISREHEAIRRRSGVLTENPSLYDVLTARENLCFFGDLYGVPARNLSSRVDALLEEFGLSERAESRVGTYSKGMRQRLAIARCLLHEPQILFFDEPTSGLDPAAARMVNDLIQRLSRRGGRTIFLCTHNLAEAQRLCDRTGVIDRGTLKALGSPRDLARQIWQALEIEVDLRGEPAPGLCQALSQMDGVRGCRYEEGRLVVEVDREESIPDLVAALVGAGARVYAVSPREYTLEEVYFEIQGEPAQRGGEA